MCRSCPRGRDKKHENHTCHSDNESSAVIDQYLSNPPNWENDIEMNWRIIMPPLHQLVTRSMTTCLHSSGDEILHLFVVQSCYCANRKNQAGEEINISFKIFHTYSETAWKIIAYRIQITKQGTAGVTGRTGAICRGLAGKGEEWLHCAFPSTESQLDGCDVHD